MATAVLRSSAPLLPLHRLESFGSRPPPPRSDPRSPLAKPPRRKKPYRSAPSSPPSASRTPPPPRRRVSFATGKENNTSATTAMVIKFPSRKLVMERVQILKRGENPVPVTSGHPAAAEEISPVFSTNRLGPEPEILPKQIGFSDSRPMYAGPAYINSPAPSSLPFPASFIRGLEEAPFPPHVPASKPPSPPCLDEAATKRLRCLLRLGEMP